MKNMKRINKIVKNIKKLIHHHILNTFENACDYYDWCMGNRKYADYKYFISLKPDACDYYLWCKNISRVDADHNIFMSLEPNNKIYTKWCMNINKNNHLYMKTLKSNR